MGDSFIGVRNILCWQEKKLNLLMEFENLDDMNII